MKFVIGVALLSALLSAPAKARDIEVDTILTCDCGLVNAAYVRGKVLTTVRAKGETFQIVPILVIGILNETGVQSVPQNVYFSVFEIDERVA